MKGKRFKISLNLGGGRYSEKNKMSFSQVLNSAWSVFTISFGKSEKVLYYNSLLPVFSGFRASCVYLVIATFWGQTGVSQN